MIFQYLISPPNLATIQIILNKCFSKNVILVIPIEEKYVSDSAQVIMWCLGELTLGMSLVTSMKSEATH